MTTTWTAITELVEAQANDRLLWADTAMPRVEYLQANLRKLHAAIEEYAGEVEDARFEARTRE